MVIVSQRKPTKQFRCRFVAGVRLYEERIPAAGGANNYQKVSEKVVRAAWNDYYQQQDVQGGVAMNPTDFIHKHIVKVLMGEGYPEDVARRGANKGVDHYRKCSQASKKGAMFDDCLHYARLEARYQTPKNERKARPARNPKSAQEKLL